MVRQVSMLGLEKRTQFEFHVSNWLGGGGGADARPVVLPEIARLDPRLLQCFYGKDEKDTACTAPSSTARCIETGVATISMATMSRLPRRS